MGRPRKKNGKAKIFYLSLETISSIKTSAGLQELSESAYVDFLIARERLSQNPMEKIKKIQFKKEGAKQKLKEIEIEEKKAIENASKEHEWQEKKRQKKPLALKAIQKAILNGEDLLAEEYAKTWQRMTGISAIELLSEANKQIQRSGI